MADSNYYVDPDVVGGLGDGSSWANAFSSSNAAETALQRSIASGDNVIVHCRSNAGSADSTNFEINGWTTLSDGILYWQVDQADRHSGKWDTSKYRISASDVNAISNREEFVRFIGLQVEVTSATANGKSVWTQAAAAAGAAIYIENCIFKGHDNDTYSSPVCNLGDADPAYFIKNCVVYNGGQHSSTIGIRCASTSTSYIYNCTGYNNYVNFRQAAAGTTYCTNCLGDNSSGNDFVENPGTLYLQYCASNDASADDQDGDGTSGNNRINQTFSFVDAANGDFHLQSSDAGAKDYGTSLASDPNYPFSDDIDGVTRTGTWDIGADEYTSAGANPKGVLNNPFSGCFGGMI